MRAIFLALSLCLASPALAQVDTLCTLALDAGTGAVLLEEGDCDSRVTPASTFKLPLAVIGFDTGFLQDPLQPVLSFQPADPDWGGENWRRDTTPTDWLLYSVVWYSQRITRALGADTLTRYARAFGYGNADFSGDAGYDNGLERAWIASSLLVSPREQADFLRGLVTDSLPVSARAMANTRASTQQHQIDGWVIHGKTGGAYPRRADRSFDYARGWGWYVGWAERGDQSVVFVRLTRTQTRQTESPGIMARAAFLDGWPALVQRLSLD
ncbi:class D beta-lactamase [Pararhodobacter zhoushanensis]|uniref:Class D beta-lactamase n=1 Tax=Pararhodobacter zhoushanensis TaxID=2479545 RepID=A0ABT3GWT6_9RHOB|nr:class D beta-lactamase [Pararhodobacter zhoushanensis]MCW1932013.1 class D beta-lactamase [Pararhodobacter zhoushanensis]